MAFRIKNKLIILTIILSLIFILYPVKANTINDCTNKAYNEVYNNLSKYEKKQLSIFDVQVVNDKLNIDKDMLKNKSDIVIGLTDYNNKTIYVSNDRKNSNNVDRILYHEIGHSIDYGYIKSTSKAIYPDGKIEYFDSSHWDTGYYSKTKEFIDIFEKEKKDINLYSDEKYFLSDSREYFVECAAIYHMKKDALERLAPCTYGFLAGILNQEI